MDDAPESGGPAIDEVQARSDAPRPVGDLLVGASLVFALAVVASVAATAVLVLSDDSAASLIDQLQLLADNGVSLLDAGLLVGAALLLVAAEFHDHESPWFTRAVGIVGALATLAVLLALFAALDLPSWAVASDVSRGGPFGSEVEMRLRIAQALDGLSVAAVAGCAATACWMLATGRIDFRSARASVGVQGADPQ